MNLSSSKGKHLLFQFLRSRCLAALFTFLLDLLSSICVIGLPFLFTQVIASLLGYHSIRGDLFGLQQFRIEFLMLGIAGITFVKLVLDFGRFWLRGQLSEDFAHALRALAFKQHLGAEASAYESRDSGRSLLRFSGDLSSAQRLLTHGVLQFSADLMLILLAHLLIIALNGLMGCIVLVFSVGGWYLTLRIHLRLREQEQWRRSSKAGLLSFTNFMLQKIASIQAFNRSIRTIERFEKKSLQTRALGQAYRKLEALALSLPLFFIQMLLLGVLILGWKLGLNISTLFLIVLILMSCRNAWIRLLKSGLIQKKGLLSLEMLAIMPSPNEAVPAASLPAKRCHTLQCCNLSIRLGEKTVIKDLDFQVSVGETLCLNWPTGGGKTVLTKAIAGLYHPSEGCIRWNEYDMLSLSRHNLRQQVSFVSEAFPLIGRNLMEAINPNNKTSSVTETTFRAWQNQFPTLQGLELQQRIDKKESGISAGQHRLLQCLHAILTNKPFLILDDVFGVLDTQTAQTLIRLLQASSAQKGILILSSQPETLLQMGWDGLQIKN